MVFETVDTIQDEVDVNLWIGEGNQHFKVVEMEVEHTKFQMPNFAKGVVVPAEDNQNAGESINLSNLDELNGQVAILTAETNFILQREIQRGNPSLIFQGKVANVFATGKGNLISILLFDPSQEAFAYNEEGEKTRNFVNKNVDFSNIEGEISEAFAVDEEAEGLPAADIVETILTDEQFGINFTEGEQFIIGENEDFGQNEFATSYTGTTNEFDETQETSGIDLTTADYIIELKEATTTPTEELTQATNVDIVFQESELTIYNVLEKIAKSTDSKIWFDRHGVFHFGGISPIKHELKYIIETDAGITTPPYQGVKVIGNPTLSTQSEIGIFDSETDLNRRDDERGTFVVEASIGKRTIFGTERERDSTGVTEVETDTITGIENTVVFHDSDDTVVAQPQFEFTDYSLLTQLQVIYTAKAFLEDIIEQSGEGEITVVGFPEIELFDGIKMPNSPVQPMGGSEFGVTKIVHDISSDGFTTRISVGGILSPPPELIGEFEAIDATDFQGFKLPSPTAENEGNEEPPSPEPEGPPQIPSSTIALGLSPILAAITASFKAGSFFNREDADEQIQSAAEGNESGTGNTSAVPQQENFDTEATKNDTQEANVSRIERTRTNLEEGEDNFASSVKEAVIEYVRDLRSGKSVEIEDDENE